MQNFAPYLFIDLCYRLFWNELKFKASINTFKTKAYLKDQERGHVRMYSLS